LFRRLRLVVAVALVGIFFVVMHGQAPSSAPPAAPASAAGGSSEAVAPITTIHARSNLVVIDVVASDSKGNPVHGLKAEDFTLLENNKPQSIKNFEEHTVLPASETAKLAKPEKLPVGMFTNKPATPASGPVNVLLLDYLNTPLTYQPYARQQLIDYLNKAAPGTRIAIFAISTNLVMLQGFSSDPEVLKAALTSKKGAPQASAILTDSMYGGVEGNNDLATQFTSDALDADQQLNNILREQAITTSFQQDLRAKITLGAFDLLARYLVGIPGRKNVIWFSGSFPLSIDPQVNLQDAFDSVVRNDDEVRKTDNLLTRAQIAVYPVDARGLFNDPGNSAINGATQAAPTVSGGSVIGGDPASATANSQMAFLQQTAQEHETMQAMAEDTGGHAFINSNNLKESVSQAISNGSNYYTLTYSPTNAQWDGKFRAVKVKVAQSGLKLAYRDGYYADDPNDRNRVIAGSSAIAAARPTAMTTAMMRGGPDPTEILFKVRIRPSANPPEANVVAGNQINPNPKVKVEGPYKQYGVDIVPDKSAITCPLGESGHRRCAIEVSTFVYSQDGTLLIATTARRAAVISASVYANMQVSGMAFHQEISVPVKGNYYIRTGVHDLNTDKVGAVEVPVAVVAHLPPLQAAAGGKAPVAMPMGPSGAPAAGAFNAPGTVPADPAVAPAAAPASAAPGGAAAPGK
jgi:VWFA-related protein